MGHGGRGTVLKVLMSNVVASLKTHRKLKIELGLAIDVIANGVDTRRFAPAGRSERNDMLARAEPE
jgi:hypothetical protein